MSHNLKYLLLQVRNGNDPMRHQEVRSFAQQLGCDKSRIVTHDLLKGAPTNSQLDKVDMVMLGGSGDYHVIDKGEWLEVVLEFLRELASSDKPTFGSCWGFQAFAKALGGKVIEDPKRAELGTLPMTLTEEGKQDPIFGQLRSPFRVVIGHMIIVDELPPGAIRLVSSKLVENEAFRLDGKPIYCTQFHPELGKQELYERLVQYPEYVKEIAGVSLEEFMAKAEETPEANRLLPLFVKHIFG